jgi:hypothetical protein
MAKINRLARALGQRSILSLEARSHLGVPRTREYNLVVSKCPGFKTGCAVYEIVLPCTNELLIKAQGQNFTENTRGKFCVNSELPYCVFILWIFELLLSAFACSAGLWHHNFVPFAVRHFKNMSLP